MDNLQFHEAANIFPMMSDDEANGLLDDIRENGLQKPIELFEGKVLDGRNRYVACLKLGPDYDYEYVELDDIDDPVAYVLSANLHRRQLTSAQRAMIGARSKEYYEEEAKKRQRLSEGRGKKGMPEPSHLIKKGKSRDAIGVAVGVAGKQVDLAKKTLAGGDPSLIEAVDSGKLKMETAFNASQLPKKTQREIAISDNPQKAAQEAVKEQRKQEEALTANAERKVLGVGTTLAREAVDKLKRIPKNDPLRKQGFQVVTDWIKKNK